MEQYNLPFSAKQIEEKLKENSPIKIILNDDSSYQEILSSIKDIDIYSKIFIFDFNRVNGYPQTNELAYCYKIDSNAWYFRTFDGKYYIEIDKDSYSYTVSLGDSIQTLYLKGYKSSTTNMVYDDYAFKTLKYYYESATSQDLNLFIYLNLGSVYYGKAYSDAQNIVSIVNDNVLIEINLQTKIIKIVKKPLNKLASEKINLYTTHTFFDKIYSYIIAGSGETEIPVTSTYFYNTNHQINEDYIVNLKKLFENIYNYSSCGAIFKYNIGNLFIESPNSGSTSNKLPLVFQTFDKELVFDLSKLCIYRNSGYFKNNKQFKNTFLCLIPNATGTILTCKIIKNIEELYFNDLLKLQNYTISENEIIEYIGDDKYTELLDKGDDAYLEQEFLKYENEIINIKINEKIKNLLIGLNSFIIDNLNKFSELYVFLNTKKFDLLKNCKLDYNYTENSINKNLRINMPFLGYHKKSDYEYELNFLLSKRINANGNIYSTFTSLNLFLLYDSNTKNLIQISYNLI